MRRRCISSNWLTFSPKSLDIASLLGLPNDYVKVDAHVLATPIVYDLDDDGHNDVIIPVSYYFDSATYGAGALLMDAKKNDVDISKYVACGIVIYDTRARSIKRTIRTPFDRLVSAIRN